MPFVIYLHNFGKTYIHLELLNETVAKRDITSTHACSNTIYYSYRKASVHFSVWYFIFVEFYLYTALCLLSGEPAGRGADVDVGVSSAGTFH